jgi:hypothetical protein
VVRAREQRQHLRPPATIGARRAVHPLLTLQRAAGNRAVGHLLQRDDKRPSAWIPTSPTLDIFAVRSQDALATTRALGQHEREIAASVYGESIDLDRVRIASSAIVNTPTTLGDTIRTAHGEIDNATLVHELMHVWQYQTQGISYISCSLAGQAQGVVTHWDRNWAYEYEEPGPSSRLANYGPEQQAMIVETAYQRRLLETGYYARLIAEVRRARPRPGGMGAAIDDRGLGPRQTAIPFGPLSPDPRSEEMGGTVPQLQWRFRGL